MCVFSSARGACLRDSKGAQHLGPGVFFGWYPFLFFGLVVKDAKRKATNFELALA